MEAIKSYTDLEQSKKLAEILPLESADMKILPFTEREYRIVPINDIAVCGIDDEIYAWSLSALISVLPLEIDTHKQTDGHKTYYYVESYMKRMGKEIYLSTERHENLVDACYELVLKLNELNLL